MISKIIKGAILGILIPTVFIYLLYLMFYFFDKNMTSEVISSGILFGLGANAFVIRILFKRDKDYLGRGIMLSSFVIIMFWLFKYIL